MHALGVSFVVEPALWPLAAAVASTIALAWELGALVALARQGRSLASALGLTLAALLAGPIIAFVAVLARPVIVSADDIRASRPLVRIALRGTLVVALAMLMILWHPAGSVLALAAAAMLWAVRAYSRTTSPIKPAVRKLLLAMRLLAILLIALLALRPALEYRLMRQVRGLVLVCVDASGSMSRRDAGEGAQPARRIDAVADALSDNARRLRALADQADVDWFSFSHKAQQIPSARSGEPPPLGGASGAATAIGDSLAGAMNPYAASGRDVAALVVLSDGCNNAADVAAPETLARQLGSRGVPIYTVGVGPETPTRNMAALNIKDLAVADEVQAFNQMGINATLDCIGLANRQVKVICTLGAAEVASETLAVPNAQSRLPLRLSHVPTAAGFQRLQIKAQVVGPAVANLTGEQTVSKLVHVIDREMRILYVEGKFRGESKFIAQALAAGGRFAVNRVVVTQPLSQRPMPGVGGNLEEWLSYHAIIFGDVPPSYFSDAQLQMIRKVIGEYGKGFCMIGGRDSFGAGGWNNTPLADLMPVDLAASKGQIDGDVKVVPTREGLASDLLRLGEGRPEQTAAAWAELPPLLGANRLAGVKLAAQTLAESAKGEPLIVAQQYEKGRSLAIAFDTTWRWVLNPKDTAESQRRFWRQVALYLCAPKGNVWIATDKSTYDSRRLAGGQDVIKVTAGVEDAQGRPINDPKVTVTLVYPDKKTQAIFLQRQGAMLAATLPPNVSEPGIYTLTITAPEVKPQPSEQQFEVTRRDLEAMDVLANHELLRQMSTESRGKYAPLRDLGALLDDIAIAARPRPREEVIHQDLTGDFRWWVLGAIIALLCLEWAIRKRKGLV